MKDQIIRNLAEFAFFFHKSCQNPDVSEQLFLSDIRKCVKNLLTTNYY
jgi:hypothetical protein